jgi:parallel beta-helix repeat protein
MKKIILVPLTVMTIICFGQYTTPASGVNWTFDSLAANSSAVSRSGNSFQVTQDIVISATDTIRVDSNLTISLGNAIEIEVLGALRVNPIDSAIFTASNTSQLYAQIRIDGSNGSYFNNTTFEYGGGLNVLNSDFIVENCTFRFNEAGNDGAIDLFRSDLTIRNNVFIDNQGPAISSGANIASAPQIINNRIERNVANGGNKSQINFGATGTDTMVIKGNTINGYYDNAGGIAIFPIGVVNVVIDSNVIDSNRYGIALLNANIKSVISNNQITKNDIQGSPNLGGSGINYNGDATNQSVVSNNIISGNLWGITIQNSAKPNLGDLRAATYNVGLNEIYNNGNGGNEFNIFNNTPDSIYAQNNIWNYSTIQDVENTISHKPDDPSLGYVNYTPVAQLVTKLTEQSKIKSATTLYPNPSNGSFNIEAEYKIEVIEWYNLQGKLVNRNLIGGEKTIRFSESKMKGQYFIKLIGKETSEVKSLILK